MRIKVVKNAIKTVNTITDSFNTILSYDLDDDQKQKILIKNSLSILSFSLMILFMVITVATLFIILNYFNNSFLAFSLSFISIIEAIAISTFYLSLRKYLFR
tara:strand:+ start:305 stop:610 length:306 start_codon:yes stop_codon:yes gene_type:complete